VLWERRIAMVSTYAWIKEGEAEPALTIARVLLDDREDLMHKAVGWMLREVGKRVGKASLEGFLGVHADEMPRTALRYAIERFSEEERRHWLGRGKGVRAPSAPKRSALRRGP
jgi:3-methyladenine DNA glycosylase AlkD